LKKTLSNLLKDNSLEQKTSPLTWERGQDYVAQARVLSLTITSHRIAAAVQGSQLYQVSFWRKGKILQYSCTCPFACEGAFCKHCVAVALTFRSQS
jgi:uncharacterized Zn finger protein